MAIRLLFVLAIFLPGAAFAAVRDIVTPRGLHVWFVEDHATDITTIGFRFAGGTAADPPGLEGLANLTAQTLLQSGGRYDSDTFRRAFQDLAAETDVEARFESIRGTLKVLTHSREDAAHLLALAINQPHLTEALVDDLRDQVLADIDAEESDPEAIGYAAYGRLTYGAHPIARTVTGTREGVAAIRAADIAGYRERMFTRDRLSLSVVGNVGEREAGQLIDKIFGGLPVLGDGAPALTTPAIPRTARRDVPMPASEAQVVFGIALGNIPVRDLAATEIVEHILGGSAFTSRLYTSIRDRHGLAYAIGTSLDAYSVVTEITGSFGTEPERTEEALVLLREELARMGRVGPTDDEVAEAKVSLAGQFLRGLVKQADLANELTLRRMRGFGPDVIDTFAARLDAVTADEVRALARSIPWLERLNIVTVGARPPAGPDPTGGPIEAARAPKAPQGP